MPLHVLDCTALPGHTCVWGRLPQNISVLAPYCHRRLQSLMLAMLQHTMLLMPKELDRYSHCLNPPSLAPKSMVCTNCKTVQPELSAGPGSTRRQRLRHTHPTMNLAGQAQGCGALKPYVTLFYVPRRCLNTCWTWRSALPKLIVSTT